MISCSRQGRSPTEEAPREEPRVDAGADRATRAADLCDRGCQHQPGDAERDEAGRQRHGTDPRQADHREGGRDDVRTCIV